MEQVSIEHAQMEADLIMSLLEANGIKRNCRSWNAYERAKQLIGLEATSGTDYDRRMFFVISYLGL